MAAHRKTRLGLEQGFPVNTILGSRKPSCGGTSLVVGSFVSLRSKPVDRPPEACHEQDANPWLRRNQHDRRHDQVEAASADLLKTEGFAATAMQRAQYRGSTIARYNTLKSVPASARRSLPDTTKATVVQIA
jgi:hypothetical protein